MREPIFNETLQLGIAVRDLAATMRTCADDGEIENEGFQGSPEPVVDRRIEEGDTEAGP